MLVHLTDAKNSKSIAAGGLRGQKTQIRTPDGTLAISKAVHCMPVLPDYFITHQWLRELKRRGMRTLVGVYIRLPSDETVWVGYFNKEHRQMSLGDAIHLIAYEADAQGFEIIIPHSILKADIHKVRGVSQKVGWRFFPKAHTTKPFCGCKFCTGGEIKAKRFRERLEQSRKS